MSEEGGRDEGQRVRGEGGGTGKVTGAGKSREDEENFERGKDENDRKRKESYRGGVLKKEV